MIIKSIPSSWLARTGRRLDCGPYTSGALEARIRLEEIAALKQPLRKLTFGYEGGIYNGPHFSRTWVEDANHGVPFLGSSAMLMADLSNLPYLSKKEALSPKLLNLRIRPGMTLISCSGTIGRMVYARPDMDGMWTSQHIMKVVPDPEKIPPGYLYAYLSSRFGASLVASGTYGSIVQSIEPQHIADIPVPRLGDALERQVHELVEEAGRLRSEAGRILSQAVKQLEETSGLSPMVPSHSPMPYSSGFVSSSQIRERFDAFFHSSYRLDAVAALRSGRRSLTTVASLADSIVEPGRFKRIPIPESAHGVAFLGTSALMWSEPKPMYYLPKSHRGMPGYLVEQKTLLIPRSGQLSGIIGHVVMPYGDVIGGAVSEDAIRVNCRDMDIAGYLFVALSSEYGIRQLKARAYGSSIPHLDIHQIGRVLVPDLKGREFSAIGGMGSSATELRSRAVVAERQARALVEKAIGEAS